MRLPKHSIFCCVWHDAVFQWKCSWSYNNIILNIFGIWWFVTLELWHYIWYLINPHLLHESPKLCTSSGMVHRSWQTLHLFVAKMICQQYRTNCSPNCIVSIKCKLDAAVPQSSTLGCFFMISKPYVLHAQYLWIWSL